MLLSTDTSSAIIGPYLRYQQNLIYTYFLAKEHRIPKISHEYLPTPSKSAPNEEGWDLREQKEVTKLVDLVYRLFSAPPLPPPSPPLNIPFSHENASSGG